MAPRAMRFGLIGNDTQRAEWKSMQNANGPDSEDDEMVQIDPRLRVPGDLAYHVRQAAGSLRGAVSVFLTSSYDMPLAAELVNKRVIIRAATGDEVAAFLDDEPIDPEEKEPGPRSAAVLKPEESITWHEVVSGDTVTEKFLVLWSGEVLLNNGRGVSGPFYCDEIAARAWAFSTALSMPEAEVCAAQVVAYRCAESKVPMLLADGDVEYRHFQRFVMPPVRSGAVYPVRLPTETVEEG